jgi:hypothetical protein
VAVLSTNSPTRKTFDVDVKIAGETSVEKGVMAIFVANMTIISRWWQLEKKGVLWVHYVLYHVGQLFRARFVKEEVAFGNGAFVSGTECCFLASRANYFLVASTVQLFYVDQVMPFPPIFMV